MATYTEKLGLKLPSQTDFYNVDDFNENFRKLDENTAQGEDIQQVLTLADPIRSNRAPTTADKQYAGKLWVVPKMIFNNMMPNALAQVASNWKCTASTSSVSGSSATIVGDGTASTIVSEVDMTAVRANDIVYINAKMAVTADANGATIELLCGDDVIATTSMSIPTAGNSTQLIDYIKVNEAGALKLRVTAMYNSASAQLGKGVTVSDITILDLTADMCQNFAGIEFTKDETTAYINTYGGFQTKTYELSEYWWICRGSYGGQYSWQRYDDEINNYSDNYQRDKATTTDAQGGTNDSHWMTPLKTQQFLTNKLATQTEAQAGSDNTKVMTPLRVANQITAKIATQTEAQAGSVDTKIMTPLKTQQFFTNRLATQSEADAGTSTTKAMTPALVKRRINPYYSSNIGDIIHTANNAEAETNGAFIKMDGRNIDTRTGYPLLINSYELSYRVANPTLMSQTGVEYSCNLYNNGTVAIDGNIFFLTTYAESSSSGNNDSLCIRKSSGEVSRLLSRTVECLVECQGQVIAFTSRDNGVRAVVYDSTGTQVRDVTLLNNTNYTPRAYVYGNRIFVYAAYNGNIEGFYTDNNFSTHGTSTWAGGSSYSGEKYPMGDNYQGYLCGVQQAADGYLYLPIEDNSGRTKYVIMLRSTDLGKTWTEHWSYDNTNKDRCLDRGYFIAGSYVYFLGHFVETSGSYEFNEQCIIKLNLSNGGYVARTSVISSGIDNSFFGFVQGSKAYLAGDHWSIVLDLNSMAVSDWETSNGETINMRTNAAAYLTKDGKYWLATSEYGSYKSTYSTYTTEVYKGLLVYDTVLHKSVYLTGGLLTSSNSGAPSYGGFAEDINGVIYFPRGTMSDNTFYNSAIVKLDPKIKRLHELDYAYIKAKEMA